MVKSKDQSKRKKLCWRIWLYCCSHVTAVAAPEERINVFSSCFVCCPWHWHLLQLPQQRRFPQGKWNKAAFLPTFSHNLHQTVEDPHKVAEKQQRFTGFHSFPAICEYIFKHMTCADWEQSVRASVSESVLFCVLAGLWTGVYWGNDVKLLD